MHREVLLPARLSCSAPHPGHWLGAQPEPAASRSSGASPRANGEQDQGMLSTALANPGVYRRRRSERSRRGTRIALIKLRFRSISCAMPGLHDRRGAPDRPDGHGEAPRVGLPGFVRRHETGIGVR